MFCFGSMQEAIQKAKILIEALPYFKAFDEKIVVVKLGGNAIHETSLLHDTLVDIVFMEQVGIRPVLVHGGGPHISARLKEANIPSCFVEGLRVTDAASLKIVEEVLLEINASMVRDITDAGGHALTVHGANDGLFEACQKKMVTGGQAVDLGFVGEVTRVRPEKILEAVAQGRVPVISPLARSRDGQIYNVNADTAAAQLAGALKAEKLVFMSNIAGILRNIDDPESLLGTLHEMQVRDLISSGVISGGMLPKVEASLAAMGEGVSKVHIIDGRKHHSLLLEIFTPQGIGTQFVKEDHAT